MLSDFANLFALMAVCIIGLLVIASWIFDYWDWWYALSERLPW